LRRGRLLGASIAGLSLVSCAAEALDGRDVCTSKAIGDDTGAESITTELLIPKSYISGAEISNGGVAVLHPDCDFALNAFLSEATVETIIAEAAEFPEDRPALSTATAELFIWRFRDSSDEPRFFVISYHNLQPFKTDQAAISVKTELE
jgi:hypothetical protein